MSQGLNKVMLIGRLGKDPEFRQFSDGQLCRFRLATGERWNDRQSGERKEHTEWHNVVLKGGIVEAARMYLKKGMQVFIEGRLRTRSWQDKQGQDRFITEVQTNRFQILDWREYPEQDLSSGGVHDGLGEEQAPSLSEPGVSFDDFDDGIPF